MVATVMSLSKRSIVLKLTKQSKAKEVLDESAGRSLYAHNSQLQKKRRKLTLWQQACLC